MIRKKSGLAQSMMEYAIVLGLISAALAAMQVYFRRNIQSVVKFASDQLGDQRKGGVEYDYRYEMKPREGSNVSATTFGTKAATIHQRGGVTYDEDETTTQEGVLFKGTMWPED
ncbi:MAG: hypothetical protein KKC84_00555 [Candidatus Omnitrophica bacterium]|nr:hypothetical protein [Candidatus Omnitrophota bacterium]